MGYACALTHLGFPGNLVSDHAGKLHHLAQVTLGVVDRVIGGFQPHLVATTVDPLEAVGHVLSAIKFFPESVIFRGVGFFGRAEFTVVLANEFVKPIAHGLLKLIVRRDNRAVEVKLNNGGGTDQRINERLAFFCTFQGFGYVAGVALNVSKFAVLSAHGKPMHIQPNQWAIGTQVTVVVADGRELCHRLVEIMEARQFRDMGRHNTRQWSPQKLLWLVTKSVGKVLIYSRDTEVGVKPYRQHAPIHLLRQLAEHGQFCTLVFEFFFELAVKHQETPTNESSWVTAGAAHS